MVVPGPYPQTVHSIYLKCIKLLFILLLKHKVLLSEMADLIDLEYLRNQESQDNTYPLHIIFLRYTQLRKDLFLFFVFFMVLPTCYRVGGSYNNLGTEFIVWHQYLSI